jgi:hypothetical protein
MHATTLHQTLVVNETLTWEDVVIGGDADGALIRVDAGGRLIIRGGHITRTGGWGSLIHVQGGDLVLADVTLAGAQEHYLLPEPRPPVGTDYLHGAVLVTASGQAKLTRVQASGNAPALRISIGKATVSDSTFSGTATAVVDVQAESRATLTDCQLEGTLYGAGSRITLRRCRLDGATTHYDTHLALENCDIRGSLCPTDGKLTVQGGEARSAGTVVFARDKAVVTLTDLAIRAAGGRGVELQGASNAHLQGGCISGTAGDGVAAFDAATLVIAGTTIEAVGGVPVLLAGASDGPEGADADEFARPGGPGGDASAILRQRLDAIGQDARLLLVERLADRADETLRRWATSCKVMGSAAMDLRDQGPLAKVKGAIIGLAPTGGALWILTRKQVHKASDGTITSWTLPAQGVLLAADSGGAIVATVQGLYNPQAGEGWPLPRSGAVSHLRLDGGTVHVDGGDTDGHPTDRSTWRFAMDRATGTVSPVTLVEQGGCAGPGIPTAVQTPAGEARIWSTSLQWQSRFYQLPGGITTLAADSDTLLVGTGDGEVYRLG